MRIANLAESTQRAYLFEVERMAKHYATSPIDLDGEQVRDWVLTLIDRGVSPSSTNSTHSDFKTIRKNLTLPERTFLQSNSNNHVRHTTSRREAWHARAATTREGVTRRRRAMPNRLAHDPSDALSQRP